MPCRPTDLGAVEADVGQRAIIEVGELPDGAPVPPPCGECPDQVREVHLSSFHDEGPPDAAPYASFVGIAAQ